MVEVDELKAAIAVDHALAEWYGDTEDITLETFLGAPALTLHVRWTEEEPDGEAKARMIQAMSDALAAYPIPFAHNLAVIDEDGMLSRVWGTGEHGAEPMSVRFELPPPPRTAAALRAWLDAVYGPAGLVTLGPNETWYDSIARIESAGGTLLVRTRLAEKDRTQLDLLRLALHTTGSPLLEHYSIRGADHRDDGFAPAGEPGKNGFYYPAE